MNNLKEIYEAAEKVKISIVMQVNLEEYDGHREEVIYKFNRAITSFKNQIYKNCELIIVADGCNKTYQLYNRMYKNDTDIKFIYYDRSTDPKMCEVVENKGTYYRGFARELGVAAATGELINYMNSDDYLLPKHTLISLLYYNSEMDKDWWINTSWFDPMDVNESNKDNKLTIDTNTIENIEIDEIGGSWKPMEMIPDNIRKSSWLLTHKKSINIKWRDVISDSVLPDVDFYNRMMASYPNGSAYKIPTYIRCHNKGHWDI